MDSRPIVRVALIGDRSPHVVAHSRIPEILGGDPNVDLYWIGTENVDPDEISGFDAVWVVPGSPYRAEDGALAAIRTARERGIPFLGTCGGFQHTVLEYARSVAGRPGSRHLENAWAENPCDPRDDLSADDLIVPLRCSLVGHEDEVIVAAGTRAAAVLGALHRRERFHCEFGLRDGADETLVRAGLVVSGRDAAGNVRIVELPDHPFFLATLFQPELADEQPHPIIGALIAAASACDVSNRGRTGPAPRSANPISAHA